MEYYVSPYIQAGLHRIPKGCLFIPRDMSWTSVDMQNGFAIVALPDKVSCSATTHLCSCPKTKSLAVRRHLERKFNLSYGEETLGGILFEHLVPRGLQPAHASRWPRNILPEGEGQYEIWLGNECVFCRPAALPAPGIDPLFTDSFNRADESPLGNRAGIDPTDWDRVSSVSPPFSVPRPDLSDLKIVTGNGDLSHHAAMYVAANLAADQDVDIATAAGSGTIGGETRGGPDPFVGTLAACVRMVVGRYYLGQVNNSPQQLSVLLRTVAGFQTIGTLLLGGTYSGIVTVGLISTGSSFTADDGVNTLGVTDTQFNNGNAGFDVGGVGAFSSGGTDYTGQQFADNFTVTADLLATGGFTPGTC